MAKEAQKSEKFAQSYTTYKRQSQNFNPGVLDSILGSLSHTALCYNDWPKVAYVEPAVGGA